MGGGRGRNGGARVVRSGLYVGGVWLLLKDGVVASTFALRLLTVFADGVCFVALGGTPC